MRMKNYFYLLIIMICFLSSCSKEQDQYRVGNYLDKTQADTLLVDVVTYIATREGIDPDKRFDKAYRSAYRELAKRFEYDQYFISEKDSTHYILLMRHVRNQKVRAVAAKVKLSGDRIVDFEESFVSPAITYEEARERGRFIWREWIKNGNIDQYVKMKTYIEWPGTKYRYDKTAYKWVVRTPE